MAITSMQSLNGGRIWLGKEIVLQQRLVSVNDSFEDSRLAASEV